MTGELAVPRLTQDGHRFFSEASVKPSHSVALVSFVNWSAAVWMMDSGQNRDSWFASGVKGTSSLPSSTKRANTGREVLFSIRTVDVMSMTLRPCVMPLCRIASKRLWFWSSRGRNTSRSLSTAHETGANDGIWIWMEREGIWW